MNSDSHLNAETFSWQPNAKLLLLVLLMMPLLISLGYWQLDRAQEKREILAEFKSNQQSQPATFEQLGGSANLQYRQVQFVGELDASRRVLLDNRVRNGRPGYEIFEVLTIAESRGSQLKVLVNRGWVEASLDRNTLPEIEPVLGQVTLRGSLYRVLRGGLQLDDGVRAVENWPGRVGWISTERAVEIFGNEFFVYQLRLDSDSIGALTTGWPAVSVQPEKHTAYAVQWFVMAFVLLLMTINANSNLAAWYKFKTAKTKSETL
jgi:surfeit locus 1 family protein